MDSPQIVGEMPSHWVASNRKPWIIAASLVAAGVAFLFVLSSIEAHWLKAQPWSRALWTEDYVIKADGTLDAWSRQLSIEQSLGDSPWVRMIQDDLTRDARAQASRPHPKEKPDSPLSTKGLLNLEFLPRASLLMIALPREALQPVLESGRLPDPGKGEVLAGALLSARELVVDGQHFTVTGHLRPQASGFTKVYLLPHDPAMETFFTDSPEGKHGSFVADGADRIEALIPALADPAAKDLPKVHGGPVQTCPWIAWGVWTSLLLVAGGFSLAFVEVYRHLSRLPIPGLSHAMQEIVLRPRLIWGLHIVFFGGFFGAMALGLLDAELNYFFTQYASHEFIDGGLQYVGDAYESGNIPRAAQATFYNNFVVQTLCLSAGASLVPPFFLGLIKILLSFVVVGFAMAPLWTETAGGMTYHVITLGLELPPYVLAGFGCAVWTRCIWRFLWSPLQVWYLGDKARGEPLIQEAARQLPRGLLVLAGATLASGVFLYAAAWYEALTLILFR